eukprot:TRINITY_DN13758_c0_g2_i2.p1 TRINITY_DN13758_c0_g2~~TRINITY_DN13758_c0_g2_i2.p1  ORF type:complete len:1268 (+),score=345.96 TRINITY_DN13758_c0_g2_i2:78-3806(+)
MVLLWTPGEPTPPPEPPRGKGRPRPGWPPGTPRGSNSPTAATARGTASAEEPPRRHFGRAGPRRPLSARVRPAPPVLGTLQSPESPSPRAASREELAERACFAPLFWSAELDAYHRRHCGRLPRKGDMVVVAGECDLHAPGGSVLRTSEVARIAAVREGEAMVIAQRPGREQREGPFPLWQLQLRPSPRQSDLAAAYSVVSGATAPTDDASLKNVLPQRDERTLRRAAAKAARSCGSPRLAVVLHPPTDSEIAAEPHIVPLWHAFVAAQDDAAAVDPAGARPPAAAVARAARREFRAGLRSGSPTAGLPLSPGHLSALARKGLGAFPWADELLTRLDALGEETVGWAQLRSFARTAQIAHAASEAERAGLRRPRPAWRRRDKPWRMSASQHKVEKETRAQAGIGLGQALSKSFAKRAKNKVPRMVLKHHHGRVWGLSKDERTGTMQAGTVSDMGAQPIFPKGVPLSGQALSRVAPQLQDGDRIVYDVAVESTGELASPRVVRFHRQAPHPAPAAPAPVDQPPPRPPTSPAPASDTASAGPRSPQARGRGEPRPPAGSSAGAAPRTQPTQQQPERQPSAVQDLAGQPDANQPLSPAGISTSPTAAGAASALHGAFRTAAQTGAQQRKSTTVLSPMLDGSWPPALMLTCGDLPPDKDACREWSFGCTGCYRLANPPQVVNRMPVWTLRKGERRRHLYSDPAGHWKITDDPADFREGRGWVTSARHQGQPPHMVEEWRQRATLGPPFFEPGPTAMPWAGVDHPLRVTQTDAQGIAGETIQGLSAAGFGEMPRICSSLPTDGSVTLPAAVSQAARDGPQSPEHAEGSGAPSPAAVLAAPAADAGERRASSAGRRGRQPRAAQAGGTPPERRDSSTSQQQRQEGGAGAAPATRETSQMSPDSFAALEREFQRLFQLADTNQSGGLTLREFLSLGDRCSAQDKAFFTRSWFERADTSGDGVISLAEFIKEVIPDAEVHWARRCGKAWGHVSKDKERGDREARRREENPVGWWCCGQVVGDASGQSARGERVQFKVVDDGGHLVFEQNVGGRRLQGRLLEVQAHSAAPAFDGSYAREGQKEWKADLGADGVVWLRLSDGTMESLWAPRTGKGAAWNVATMRPVQLLAREVPEIFELWRRRSALAAETKAKKLGQRRGRLDVPATQPGKLTLTDLRRNIHTRSMSDEDLVQTVLDGQQYMTENDFGRLMRSVYSKHSTQQAHNDVRLFFQEDTSMPPGASTQQLELPEVG